MIRNRMPSIARSTTLSRLLLVPVALILLVPGAIAVNAATGPDAGVQLCFVPGSGTVYRVGEPGLPQSCHSPTHTLFGVQAAGSPVSAITFQVRTAQEEISPTAAGQNTIAVHCEDGETAISGGGRTFHAGGHPIVSWVQFDLGDGPIGSPPTGWKTGYSYSPGPISDLFAEAWVICVS